MAELFPRYSGNRVSTVGPRAARQIDFAAGREAVATADATARAMDSISDFAFGQAKQRLTLEGQAQGAADPKRTLLGLEDRDLSSLNIKEAAAFTTAVKGISAEIEVKAKAEMGKVYLQSIQDNDTPEVLGEKLDMVNMGFSESLALMDPGTAQAMALKLDDYRNSQFLNYSEKYIKEERKKNRAEGALALDEISKTLENQARAPLATADQDIKDGLDTIASFLQTKGYQPEEIAREVTSLKKRAYIAKARGGFDRMATPEAQLQYADDFEASIGKRNGLAANLDDDTAQTLVNNFRTKAKAAKNALNGEISNLAADIKSEVGTVVTAGAVPAGGVINKLKARIETIEQGGGDKTKIAELKDALSTAEGHIAYFRDIQTFSTDDLIAEKTRLEQTKDEGATPGDILRLKVVSARLRPELAEAKAQNAAWVKTGTAISKSIDALEKVVENFLPLRDEDLQAAETAISKLAGDGAPSALVDSLTAELTNLRKIQTIYNDIADDSSLDLEKRTNKLKDQARESGASPEQNDLIKNLDTRINAQNAALNKDALEWANEAGVVDIQTDLMRVLFNPASTPEVIASAIEVRKQNANKVASHYGIPKQLLTQEEADSISTALTEQPIELQAGLLGTLVSAFGEDSIKVLRQTSKNAPVLAHIGGMVVNGTDNSIITNIMKGRLLASQRPDFESGELVDIKEQRLKMISGMTGSEATIKAVGRIKRIADFIYLATKDQEGKTYEEALQDAGGRIKVGGEDFGGFVSYKSKGITTNLLLPPNIRQDKVGKIMGNLKTYQDVFKLAVTQDDKGKYVTINQAPIGSVNQEEIDISFVRNSNLITVDDGIFKIMYNGEELKAPNGQPYLLDFKKVQQ